MLFMRPSPIVATLVFWILVGWMGKAAPAEAIHIQVSVDTFFEQYTSGDPVPLQEMSYRSEVRIPASREITDVFAITPTGKRWEFFTLAGDSTRFFSSQDFPDITQGPGDYEFHLESAGTNQLIVVSVPTQTNSVPPRIFNYAEVQSLNPTNSFTLSFTSGWTNLTDAISLDIADDNGSGYFFTPLPGEPAGLNGSSNLVTVPARTLPPDYVYRLGIYAYRGQTNVIGDVVTVVHSSQITWAQVVTMGGVPVRFSHIISDTNGFSATLSLNAGATYQIQRSLDLESWTFVKTVHAYSDNYYDPITYRFTDSYRTNGLVFYRVFKSMWPLR